MPRIKRWFPVNHNINRDPEVWAMRKQIGEKSLSIWLEFLSIADQNESELPGDYDQLIRSVSGTCQSTVRTVTAVYEFAVSKLWITPDPTPKVAKYRKYHMQRDAYKIPQGKDDVSLPSEPTQTEPKKKKKENAASPLDGLLGFDEFWAVYPKKVDKPSAEKAWIKARIQNGTREAIMAGLQQQKLSHGWTKNGGEFIPNPATWLNHRRWEDEITPTVERGFVG